jgi:FkbM family methyltransferase
MSSDPLRARDIGIRPVSLGVDRVFVDSVDRYLAAWAWKLGLRGGGIRRLIAREVAGGMVAVDVGANVGCCTLALARQVGPGGRVFALEPDARSFELLTRAVGGVRWPQVDARPVAAADYSGWATLYVSALDQGDHRIVPPRDERRRATVRAVTLDDLLAGEARVDFIKLSARGAEAMVLRGMRATLARIPPPRVLCVLAPALLEQSGANAEAVCAPLREAGLEAHRVLRSGDVAPVEPSAAWSLARTLGRLVVYFRPRA